MSIFTKTTSTISLIPSIQLLRSQLLTDFSSGSSINYYDEKLYLIGDDASHVLVLDKHYEKLDSIMLFNYSVTRIPKAEKVDLEASLLIQANEENFLLALGSASREERKRVMLISLLHTDQTLQRFRAYNTSTFVGRLLLGGIDEINIEGATLAGNYLVLANRGNAVNANNQLIITTTFFWENQQEANVNIAQLVLPLQPESFIGISEICYVESQDVLLVTLSSEATTNSYDDGAIGDSYIGWIHKFQDKIRNATIRLDDLINLSDVSEEFRGEKIEGICAESVVNAEYLIHLVSDNDQGETRIFKINLNF